MSNTRIRSAYLILALIALLVVACAPLPPVIPGPEAPTSEPSAQPPTVVPPTVVSPTEVAAFENPTESPGAPAIEATPVITGTESITGTMRSKEPPAMTAITGSVTYRQRIALAPDAVVEVELQDISRADAVATVLGSQRIETQGAQVPIPFSVEYDLSQIRPEGVYSLRARIIEGGLMTWITADAPRVLTSGAPTERVEILVQPAAVAEPVTPAAGQLNGVVTYRQRIALPPTAVVEVQLQDVSRADAPAIILASQTIQTQGQQVPIPFSLTYDPTAIDPRMTYAVRATIKDGDRLIWTSATFNPVLTRDAPAGDIEIIVDQVSSS